MLRNFLSCSKGGKHRFEVQDERCDLTQVASAEKGLIWPGGENLLDFLELWRVPLELRRGSQGPTLVASGKASFHASSEGSLRIVLQSVSGLKASCGVEAGI